MIRRLAPFAATVVAATALFGGVVSARPEGERISPMGASVAPDGTLLSVACPDGRALRIQSVVPGGVATVREVRLPGLPEDATILDARIAPFEWREGHFTTALALVVRRAGRQAIEYRYAVERDRDASPAWGLSDPIFEDAGPRWRIAEVRQNVAEGDTIEILFTRGFVSPHLGIPDGRFEVRQFTDVCPGGGAVGIGGKDRLVDLAPKR